VAGAAAAMSALADIPQKSAATTPMAAAQAGTNLNAATFLNSWSPSCGDRRSARLELTAFRERLQAEVCK